MGKEFYIRPDNLMDAIFGEEVPQLSEEEHAMKSLLLEEYRKDQKNLLETLRHWRSDHPGASLGEALRALYQELEDEKKESHKYKAL